MEKLNAPIKGYKMFGPDWDCRGKKYTCPGEFEENVTPVPCKTGMHFCIALKDCFEYYKKNPQNHCAEVIALGTVIQEGNKCVTDHLRVVREIPWNEVIALVNAGKGNTGILNTGNCNTGNWNTGDCNTGNCNTGNWNTGDWNTGDCNTGNWNTGDRNTGNCNTGNWNTGNRNTGNWNTGDRNTGNWNTGNRNTGDRNTGNWNTGNWNTGNRNTGDRNTGNWNTGDWNKTSYSNGVFCTKEPEILIFDKPSGMTLRQWRESDACKLLDTSREYVTVWVWASGMTDDEKKKHPEYKTTGGYLKKSAVSDGCILWWEELSEQDRDIIRSIPNFDPKIFKEITGIDA